MWRAAFNIATYRGLVSDRLSLNDIRDVLAESYGRDEDDREELRLRDDMHKRRKVTIMDRRWG